MSEVSNIARNWKKLWEQKRQADNDYASAWLPWFRGEEHESWATTLQPKLYRNSVDIKKILLHEQEMRVEFRRRGAQLITERQPIDKWEWYFLMQHYKAPTRLLDWSDGALVGLYFAVSSRGNAKDSDDDAVVYMLDPWGLNEHAFKHVTTLAEEYRSVGPALPDWDEALPYLPDEFESDELGLTCPLAIDPSHFSRRIAAQRSHFTIFGRDKDGLKGITSGKEDCLVRFLIRRATIPQIKDDLRLAGISEETIFPDLEGLGRELSYWFNDNCSDDSGLTTTELN